MMLRVARPVRPSWLSPASERWSHPWPIRGLPTRSRRKWRGEIRWPRTWKRTHSVTRPDLYGAWDATQSPEKSDPTARSGTRMAKGAEAALSTGRG